MHIYKVIQTIEILICTFLQSFLHQLIFQLLPLHHKKCEAVYFCISNFAPKFFIIFKNDGEEHYIPFFAAEGVTELNTTLKNFNFDANIKGASQQDLLNEYTQVMSRFNDKNLNLMQANFLAQKENDSLALDSIIRASNRLIKTKYSYTIQFAINNKDSEVAPYLALYEMPNANPVYIDSIYNNLTDDIKASLYGKRLSEVIKQN